MIETGTLLKWTDGGFGFIVPDSGGVDVFAHIQKFRGQEPVQGMRVTFDTE